MAPDPRFAEALRLFNAGEYFVSHEVMEELWLETPAADPMRDLYKGVIQCAAALFLLKRGPQTGAVELCRTATGYLEKYRPERLGLEVDRLIGDMRTCFSAFDGWDKKTKVEVAVERLPKAFYAC